MLYGSLQVCNWKIEHTRPKRVWCFTCRFHSVNRMPLLQTWCCLGLLSQVFLVVAVLGLFIATYKVSQTICVQATEGPALNYVQMVPYYRYQTPLPQTERCRSFAAVLRAHARATLAAPRPRVPLFSRQIARRTWRVSIATGGVRNSDSDPGPHQVVITNQ